MGGGLSSLAELPESMTRSMERAQTKMMKKQVISQATMQKVMLSQQLGMGVAGAQDRLNWIGGWWGCITGGVIGLRATGRAVPGPLMIPVVALPYLMLFTADMAYGTKAERIFAAKNDLLNDKTKNYALVNIYDERDAAMAALDAEE